MKKSILSLGKSLTKTQLQKVKGGALYCSSLFSPFCNENWCTSSGGIWYACAGECYDSNAAHFPPC